MGTIHPFGHGLVMCIRDQQRQAKAAQQTFGSAFPIALIFTHLNQFTSKRHFLHV